jgi:hypothetical protein
MTNAFGRDALLDAFDRIGRAAVQAGTKLQIVMYGGSALMLASNFRFATEEVHIHELPNRRRGLSSGPVGGSRRRSSGIWYFPA